VTVQRRTIEAAAIQHAVIAALQSTGDLAVADRLERCMHARHGRRSDGGWPWTCRSAGCAWCGRTLLRKWWLGLSHWIVQDGAPVSLALVPLNRQRVNRQRGDVRRTVQRLRRSLRDLRDRSAQRDRRWRSVSIAGMAGGNGKAMIPMRHPPGLPRAELAMVLHRRWPGLPVGDVGDATPSWPMTVAEMAELARLRRGVEPLRVVLMEQRVRPGPVRCGPDGAGARRVLEPMPWLL
jgi:hypothetical protein